MYLVSIEVREVEHIMKEQGVDSNEEKYFCLLEGNTTYHAECRQSHRVVSSEVVRQSERIGATNTCGK